MPRVHDDPASDDQAALDGRVETRDVSGDAATRKTGRDGDQRGKGDVRQWWKAGEGSCPDRDRDSPYASW